MVLCKWFSVFLMSILSITGYAQGDDILHSLQIRNAYENSEGFLIVDLQIDSAIDPFLDSIEIGSKRFSVEDHFFWRLSPGLPLHQLHLTQAKEILVERPHETQPIRQFTARYSDFQANCKGRESSLKVTHSERIEISSCLSDKMIVLNAVTPERKRELQDQVHHELISLEPYPDFRAPLALLKFPQTQTYFYLDVPAYRNGLPIQSYHLPRQVKVYYGTSSQMKLIPVQAIQRKWGYLQLKFLNENHISRFRNEKHEPYRYYVFEAERHAYTPLEVLSLDERTRLKINFNEVNPSRIHTPSEVYFNRRSALQWIHFQPSGLFNQMKTSLSW